MTKIIMLKGLPGSGKSTRAKEQVKNDKLNTMRINKDDLRTMLHDGKRSKGNETQVISTRNALIREYLEHGLTVIVDDTNLHPKHETNLRNISSEYGAEFQVKTFNTSVFECIERDAKRENGVGYKVIMNMYESFVQPKPNLDTITEETKECYIFDIDGTLASMHDRHPYERDKVGNDKPNHEIIEVAKSLSDAGYAIVVMSGRNAVCKEQTKKRLEDYDVPFDELMMRATNDDRKDSVVKSEMTDYALALGYGIMGVFDDRQQTTEMFRARGLRVFNVSYGAF